MSSISTTSTSSTASTTTTTGDSNLKTNKARKRASTRRSKTGCITCKIRRLKCGEEKPSCRRCQMSGWHCDGYVHLTPPSTSKTHLVVQPSTAQTRTPSPCSSDFSTGYLHQDERENYYMQCFLEDVTRNLQSSNTCSWRQSALDASVKSPAVRHAVIGTGALLASTQKVYGGTYRMVVHSGGHREFALQQYQKAITCLRETLGNLDSAQVFQGEVTCCLMLAYFDNIIGNCGFASQHINYARGVLANALARIPKSETIEDAAFEHLSTTFLSLDIRALCATGISESRSYISLDRHTPQISLPNRFYSVNDAESMQSLLLSIGYDFYYQSACYSFLPAEEVPRELLQRRDQYIHQLHVFHALLLDLLSDIPADHASHPLSRAAALKVHTSVLLIRLVSSLATPQTACDGLLSLFEYLVAIAKDTTEYEKMTGPHLVTEMFTCESRLVGALLLVATKCRASDLRREAVSLLFATHRREWMHDSHLAGEMGQWIMSLEEEGIDEIGYIPEDARVWGENVELDLQRRSATIRCRVGLFPGTRMEKVVNW